MSAIPSGRKLDLLKLQLACEQVMETAVGLQKLGWNVLSAHAVPGRPRVVATPPERINVQAGVRISTPNGQVMATNVGGVMVEWRLPGRRAASTRGRRS